MMQHQAPAAQPPQGSSSRTMTAVAIVIAALVLVAGGIGAALIVTKDKGKSSSASVTPVQKPQPKPKVPKRSHTPPVTPDPTPKPKADPGPSIGEQSQAAEAAVNEYWDDIAAHDFSSAYDFYASPATSRDAWISSEEQEGINGVEREFSMSGVGDGHATANVVRLVTRDDHCGTRHWSGSYDMVRQNGNWLIGQVNLTPSRQC
jgi:hypothetical protein